MLLFKEEFKCDPIIFTKAVLNPGSVKQDYVLHENKLR